MRWSPDTCNCIIDVDWGDDTSPTQFVGALPCPQHRGLLLTQIGETAVIESRMKNSALAIIQEDFPSIIISWHFDETRRLHFDLPPDTAPQTRTRLKVSIQAAHGDRVIIEDKS